MTRILLLLGVLIIALNSQIFATSITQRPAVQRFINTMVRRHHFTKAELNSLFSDIHLRTEVISRMKKPYEAKPWYLYRKHFLTQKRIRDGVRFWNQHQHTLVRAEKEFGVPASIIVAIIGVESLYGQYKGRFPVLDTLTTLAFNYQPRAKFFRSELKEFLLYTREEGIDPRTVVGSYAGAIGQPQFMPSSFRHYAVDYSGNGKRDLNDNTQDVIGSIANYLKANGWQRNAPIAMPAQVDFLALKKLPKQGRKPKYRLSAWEKYGITPQAPRTQNLRALVVALQDKTEKEYWLGFYNFYVITRYNTSKLYAMAVYQLGHAIEKQRTTA